MSEAGVYDAVCFTCGNAAEALRKHGVDVVEVGPKGPLNANRWISEAEIRGMWPDRFDATSGHLPLSMMYRIASECLGHLGDLPEDKYAVPTGSGETILCLSFVYPDIEFVAGYNIGPGTEYNKKAPLNGIVKSRFDVFYNEEGINL